MLDDPTIPPAATFHADELTVDDVGRLATFLDERVGGILNRHGVDSDEGRVACALTEAAGALLATLRLSLQRDDADQKALLERLAVWNQLAFIVRPWRDAPGYDSERWGLIEGPSAEAAARHLEHLRQRARDTL